MRNSIQRQPPVKRGLWRRGFRDEDAADGTEREPADRPDDPPETEDPDADETPAMPRPAFRIEEWDADARK